MKTKKTVALRLLAGVSAGALWAGGALAQPAAGAPAAAPAAAQVQEVIVTAQKRAQSVQDVSASVTALSSQRLADARVTNVSDLQTIVPTVTFGNDFNIAKIFIRGIGQNTSTSGSEPAVSLHLDGAVIARPEAQLTALFDLERVEVLRGPQGTLYGRNSTGGSINLISRKPTADYQAYGAVSLGNYSSQEIEGAVSGPIVSDRVLGRIAFRSVDRDGFGKNPITGNDVDNANRWMVRGQLMFLITPDLDLLVSAEHFRQDDASGAVHYRAASFPNVARLPPLGAGGYAGAPRDLASEYDPNTNTKTSSVTGTLNWRLNDNFSITDIANYRDFDTALTQDLDVSGVVESLATNGQSSTVQRRYTRSIQWSNELQLKFTSQHINGVGGLFYFNERQRPADTIGITPVSGERSYLAVIQAAGFPLSGARALCQQDPSDANAIPMRVCAPSYLNTEAAAVFGQVVTNLGIVSPGLDTVSIKLGGRYSQETRESANPSMILARGGLGPVVSTTYEGTYRSRDFSQFTPEVGFEWKPRDGLMVYYTYSEGFKSGAGENAAGSTTIVGPEKVKNHEAGVKSSWFERRLIANLSVYRYRLEGLQISKTINDPVAGFVTRFENAAATEGKGVELEVAAVPVSSVRLSGSVAYLDSTFKDFLTADPLDPRNVSTPPNLPPYDAVTNPTGFNPTIIQLAGNPTRNSPKWSANLHGEYDLPVALPGEGKLTVSGDASYKDETFFTEFARLLEGSRPYTTYSASLAYASGDGRVTASIWGKNLTDVFRPSSTFALATGRLVGVTYLDPATYGVSVGYKF